MASSMLVGNAQRHFTLSNSADGQSEITVYLPSAGLAAQTGGRVVVGCPGGGYSHLSMANEGHDWAEFFTSRGIAYVVLKYRMPGGDRNIPLSDAYNAIKTVRDSAAQWNIDAHKVGIMGFSAGGHLASSVCTHAEDAVRPDFAILFYPVISMDETVTHKGSCVGFLGEQRNDPALQAEWSNQNKVVKGVTPPTIITMPHCAKRVCVASFTAIPQAATALASRAHSSIMTACLTTCQTGSLNLKSNHSKERN